MHGLGLCHPPDCDASQSTMLIAECVIYGRCSLLREILSRPHASGYTYIREREAMRRSKTICGRDQKFRTTSALLQARGLDPPLKNQVQTIVMINQPHCIALHDNGDMFVYVYDSSGWRIHK